MKSIISSTRLPACCRILQNTQPCGAATPEEADARCKRAHPLPPACCIIPQDLCAKVPRVCPCEPLCDLLRGRGAFWPQRGISRRFRANLSKLSVRRKRSSRLWVYQGIKLRLACIRGISEKGAKNQALCGPDENNAARSTGSLQNGLVRLSIPEDSEDHSGHLSADMANHIHVMQTFGYFLFVIGLKHRITMHCYRGRQPNGAA